MMSFLSKRKRFLISSLVLSAGFLAMGLSFEINRFLGIALICFLTLAFFIFSLWEGLGINFTLMTLILPIYFTGAIGFFWFLLPSSLTTQIVITVLYFILIYVLLLTMNIFTVSAIRTIALIRAAKGVGFVLTLFTAFLLYDNIYSFRLPIYWHVLAVFGMSIPLMLQGYWTSKLEKKFSKELLSYSIISALVIGEIAVGLYFWPVSISVGSLFLTLAVYVLMGLGQSKLEGRLFSQIVKDHFFVAVIVFFGMLLVTSWRK